MKHASRHLGKAGQRKHWESLEKLAGVEHLVGRGWYGLRRLSADLAEDMESDARVLNRIGAWSQTETREKYQDAGRTVIHEKAAELRRKIRPGNDLDSVRAEEVDERVTPRSYPRPVSRG